MSEKGRDVPSALRAFRGVVRGIFCGLLLWLLLILWLLASW
jgi:hypothetical protein